MPYGYIGDFSGSSLQSPALGDSGFNWGGFGSFISGLGSATGSVLGGLRGTNPTQTQLAAANKPTNGTPMIIAASVIGGLLLVALIFRGR